MVVARIASSLISTLSNQVKLAKIPTKLGTKILVKIGDKHHRFEVKIK